MSADAFYFPDSEAQRGRAYEAEAVDVLAALKELLQAGDDPEALAIIRDLIVNKENR